MKRQVKSLQITDGRPTCWMCGGWGFIHPLDTGTFQHKGDWAMTGKEPVYVWAASRAEHLPGDIECPLCGTDGKTDKPYETKYPGEVLPLNSGVW